jgi:hypothetical protein
VCVGTILFSSFSLSCKGVGWTLTMVVDLIQNWALFSFLSFKLYGFSHFFGLILHPSYGASIVDAPSM